MSALGKSLVGLGVGTAAAGLGAMGGAYAGQTDGNAAMGVTVGAAAGLGIGIGATAIGYNAGTIGKNIGLGTLNTSKKAWEKATSDSAKAFYAKAGQKSLDVAKRVGVGSAKIAGNTAAVGATMAVKAGAKYGNIATSMFKVNPTLGTPNQKGGLLKMTKTGGAMLVGGALVKGTTDAFKSFNNARAGSSDGQVLTATPDASRSSNMRNAGATGDLAFAMRAQRHG